jgi:hypothetical protein
MRPPEKLELRRFGHLNTATYYTRGSQRYLGHQNAPYFAELFFSSCP